MDSDVENNSQLMLNNIQKNINSPFFLDILRKNWEKNRNVHYLGSLIGEVYLLHVINKDGFGFEYYIQQMESLYNQFNNRMISPANFDLQKAKIISIVIANKLGISLDKEITSDDITRVQDYFLQEYVTNGYVAHSFPEAYYESIMRNGLVSSTDKRNDKPADIQNVHDIFMKKGITSALGAYPYYGGSGIYYEHDFSRVFQHAIDSPEWFNWFTSSDHTTAYHDTIEQAPYVLRDEKSCRRNIEDLCMNAELNMDETKEVLDFYTRTYEKFCSPKLNVALIPKKVVGKDNAKQTVPSNMKLTDLITYVLKDGAKQYVEHRGNVYVGTIPPENFKVSVIPEASKYIQANHYLRETKENLTNPEANLSILKRAEENKERLIPSMVGKIQYAKQAIENNKREPFDKRSDTEIGIANQIRIKNHMIAQQKKIQRKKNNRKVLIKSNSSSGGGFINNLLITLLVGILIGSLFMIIYTSFR